MLVPVEMIVQSHLSDLIEMDGYFTTEERQIRLKFIKYLIHYYELFTEVDADAEFEKFLKQK